MELGEGAPRSDQGGERGAALHTGFRIIHRNRERNVKPHFKDRGSDPVQPTVRSSSDNFIFQEDIDRSMTSEEMEKLLSFHV